MSGIPQHLCVLPSETRTAFKGPSWKHHTAGCRWSRLYSQCRAQSVSGKFSTWSELHEKAAVPSENTPGFPVAAQASMSSHGDCAATWTVKSCMVHVSKCFLRKCDFCLCADDLRKQQATGTLSRSSKTNTVLGI